MRISTTARHCELDPEDRLFAEQRLEKLTRFARDIMEAHLIVTAEKYWHIAEITLKLKRHEMVGREQANDVRTAIELAGDRLEHQIRKLKGRRLDRKRGGRVRSADRIPQPVESPDQEAVEDFGDSAMEE